MTPWHKARIGLPWLFLSVILLTALLPLPCLAEGPSQTTDLATEIETLGEQCRRGEELSQEELKGLIDRCDELKTEVEQSDLRRKKLLLIRLKQTRGMCDYLLPLQESKS